MQNNQLPTSEMELTMPNKFKDRRKKNRSQDAFYIFVNLLNIVSWIFLVAALFMLHYARPEFIAGVQDYWGIEGRDFWSPEHLQDLLTLLQFCLFTALATIVLRTRRNRRKTDTFGYNLLVLLIISVVSLATIYSIV